MSERVGYSPTVAEMKWQSRIVGRGTEAPDQLLANPRNWRIHPKGQQDMLSESLDRVGWVKEVIVNKTTGFVVDGHLRVGLAISREEPDVPVSYVELNEDEEAAVVATFDPLAELAETDPEKLDSLLETLTGSPGDLVDTLSSRDDGPSPLRNGDRFFINPPVEVICPGCGHEWDVHGG